MARIRTIKPEFFVSAQIADVSPMCRLLFIGMWIFADDGGVHPASARQLKMEVFPGDDVTTDQVADMVTDLIRVGLLVEYEAQESSQVRVYWQITGWHHQKIERPRFQYPKIECGTIRRCIDDVSTMYRSPRVRAVPEPTVPETTRDEGINTTTPERVVATYTSEFEEWWSIYPKRVQKGAAFKAWQSARKRAEPSAIIDATKEFAISDKGRGDFCPYPATWLNQNRWEDDRSQWREHNGHANTPKADPLAPFLKGANRANP